MTSAPEQPKTPSFFFIVWEAFCLQIEFSKLQKKGKAWSESIGLGFSSLDTIHLNYQHLDSTGASGNVDKASFTSNRRTPFLREKRPAFGGHCTFK